MVINTHIHICNLNLCGFHTFDYLVFIYIYQLLFIFPKFNQDIPQTNVGLIGPRIRQNISVIFCFFLVFLIFLGFSWGFNYCKMANFDSRTYCNIFWSIFGTSKNVTKYGPRALYLLQKYFKQYKKNGKI